MSRNNLLQLEAEPKVNKKGATDIWFKRKEFIQKL